MRLIYVMTTEGKVAMNEQQFTTKINAVRSQLYATAILYLGNEDDALDAVDETVYKALLKYRKLRHEEYFTTWIMRILINECKTRLRKRGREIIFEELPETATNEFDVLPLKDAISRLPKDLKAPIILRYFTGMTTVETAKILKIPQGTAASRIRRALKLLRLELTEED